jgi:enoyl-CoA hydratase
MALVELERRDDGLAVVTLNNPKVNALSSALLTELRDVAVGLAESPPRAVLVTGGPKVFAAGADISEFAGPDEARMVGGCFLEALEAVAAIPRVTVAAVGGYALGGGCELALAAHLRIASTAARFGLPEVRLGIIPGYGGTVRLSRLVGKGRALELILSGEMIDAEEAHRIGLVNRVVPAESLLEEARALVERIVGNGPLALGLAIESVNRGMETSLDQALALEAHLFGLLASTEDMREGMAAFLEKRPPQFRGR